MRKGAPRSRRCREILQRLKARSDPKAVAGMVRFGISPKGTYGVPVPYIRALAREVGRDHGLAAELWASGIHEARILASMIDVPAQVTERQMDSWARDFDSWDVCDQCCSNLFDKTAFAYGKAAEWSSRKEEFVKRAGFTLMACLAVHDKKAGDGCFAAFFPIIMREAGDDRNFVRKSVNWALRQIGKRNPRLNRKAIATAQRIAKTGSKSARWIASDALRELTGVNVRDRFYSVP
jgi:3-methyladenine DNA glycosylase AlkD